MNGKVKSRLTWLLPLAFLPVAIGTLIDDWAEIEPAMPALLIFAALAVAGLIALGRRIARHEASQDA